MALTRQPNAILPLLLKALQGSDAQQAAERIAATLSPAPHDQLDFSRPIALPDLRSFLEHQEKRLKQPEAVVSSVPPLPELRQPSQDPATLPVDVVVPVYRGQAATLECLQSLLDAKTANNTPHRVIVLDDASPEPEMIEAINHWARLGRLTLIQHPANFGYIRGINRAMAIDADRDLVWLNADTRVCGNWLDRLRTWAYSAQRIASVTPLTNNGELLSFPEPMRPFPMPTADQHRLLDEQAAAWQGSDPIQLEAPCGFCMYVRRDALVDVGYLDENALHRGYGEETDWGLRAQLKGWRHLAAPNVFIAHRGGVSFGAEKQRLVERNNAVLRRRYPTAERNFDQYLKRDPLRVARRALQRGRLAELRAWSHGAMGPEPPLGALCPHPRHLHILPPPALVDIQCPFFSPPEATTGSRPPPDLLWLTWTRCAAGLRITLGAALPALPFWFDYPASQTEDASFSLLADLKSLPLQGLVIHRPTEIPAAVRGVVAALNLPSALRQLPLPREQIAASTLPPQASIVLPVAALIPAYRARWPDTPMRLDPQQQGLRARSDDLATFSPDNLRTLVIGDRLDRPRIAHNWLRLARRLAAAESPWQLVLAHTTPWRDELWNTGQVLAMPRFDILSPPEVARLSGCQVVLSLDSEPDAGWIAAPIARHFDLPLWAPQSAAAQALGARPIPLEISIYLEESVAGIFSEQKNADPGQSTRELSSAQGRSRPSAKVLKSVTRKIFLNIGSGRNNPARLPALFRNKARWRQIRLDIDPAVKPDLLCSFLNLSAIADLSVDAIYSSHSLEHLQAHQVRGALTEFHRVIKPDGFALITLPDLQAIAALITEGRLTEVAYQSPIGPITALDMLYGHGGSIAAGNDYMAHRTGFDAARLGQSLLAAGFAEVRVRKGDCFDLWAYAFKTLPRGEDDRAQH